MNVPDDLLVALLTAAGKVDKRIAALGWMIQLSQAQGTPGRVAVSLSQIEARFGWRRDAASRTLAGLVATGDLAQIRRPDSWTPAVFGFPWLLPSLGGPCNPHMQPPTSSNHLGYTEGMQPPTATPHATPYLQQGLELPGGDATPSRKSGLVLVEKEIKKYPVGEGIVLPLPEEELVPTTSCPASSPQPLLPLETAAPKAKPKTSRSRKPAFELSLLAMPDEWQAQFKRLWMGWPREGWNFQSESWAARRTNMDKAAERFAAIIKSRAIYSPVTQGPVEPWELAEAGLHFIERKREAAPDGEKFAFPCIDNFLSAEPVAVKHWKDALMRWWDWKLSPQNPENKPQETPGDEQA